MAEKKLTFGFYGKFQNLLTGVEKAKNALLSLDGIVKSVGIALTLNAGKEKAGEFADFADKINDISRKTGESVEEIQKWNNAIKMAGGDTEGFNRVLENLSNELNIPWEDGNLKAMFRTLGIQAHDASGKMRKPIEMIRDLSGKLKGMDDSSVQTFGEKFGFDQKTINLLKDGQGQLSQYLEKGKKMGIFSKEQIQKGVELKRTFNEMKTASTLLGLQIGASLTPIVQLLSSSLQAISGWFSEHSRVMKAAFVVASIYAIIKAIKSFDAACKLSALANPYVLLFSAIAVALALLVEDFLAFKEGADSLLPWKEIIEWTKNFVDELKAFGKDIADAVRFILAPLEAAGTAFGEMLFNLFSGKGFLASLEEFGAQIESFFDGIADYIINAFMYAFDYVISGFKKVTDKLGNAWKTFKGWFGFGDDEADKNGGKNAVSGGGIEEKIPHVPDVASVQNTSSSVVNNANRTMTVQKLEIKTDKVDSNSLAGIAEKAAGFDTYQANYGGV